MRLLVLGGTKFLGRAIVESALARGHEVTLFTRGQTNPGAYPEAEHLHGDRDGDLAALQGREWDAAIDTSGYVPRVVRASAELLADAVGHYAFVSSVSAYRDFREPRDEESELATLAEETEDYQTHEAYGPLKVLCEEVVGKIFRERALVVRPGLIVGPHDPTNRFPYWVHRVADGGMVLAPGRPDRQVQYIDVRDLADWLIRMADEQATGVFNAVGPDYLLTFEQLLDECATVTGSDARFVWVDDEKLFELGAEPGWELPFWLPPTDAEWATFFSVDASRAWGAGLSFRPLADTIRRVSEHERPPADAMGGITREREAELLRKIGA